MDGNRTRFNVLPPDRPAVPFSDLHFRSPLRPLPRRLRGEGDLEFRRPPGEAGSGRMSVRVSGGGGLRFRLESRSAESASINPLCDLGEGKKSFSRA